MLSARSLSDYEDLAVALARSWAHGGGGREGSLSGGMSEFPSSRTGSEFPARAGLYAEVREKLSEARARVGRGEGGGGFFDAAAWTEGFEFSP